MSEASERAMEREHEPGTRRPELFAALAAPFGEGLVKVRPQGRTTVRYVTSRQVMNRLDEVLGPENWWDEYELHPDCALCRLTIRLPDGSTLTKQDVGGGAGMEDAGDDEKSMVSDALKRAAVKFGVGRYLYGDGWPEYLRDRAGAFRARPYPSQAAETRDANEVVRGVRGARAAEVRLRYGEHAHGEVRDGRALWGWVRDMDKVHPGLLRRLGEWAERHGAPARCVEFDEEQVAAARSFLQEELQARRARAGAASTAATV